jgi:hypothetical protein
MNNKSNQNNSEIYIINKDIKAYDKLIGFYVFTIIVMIFIAINYYFIPYLKYNPNIESFKVVKIIIEILLNIISIIFLAFIEYVIFKFSLSIINFLNIFYFEETFKEKSGKINYFLIAILFPIFLYLLLGRLLFYFIKLIESFTFKLIVHSNLSDCEPFDNNFDSDNPLKDYKINNWKDINVYNVVFFPVIIPIVLFLKLFQSIIIFILILF